MIKWIEIAGVTSDLRFQYLSQFLNENGTPNKLELVACKKEDFIPQLEQAMKKFDFIRVGSPFSEKLPFVVEQLPMLTLTQKTADCLIKNQGRWWARSMLAEGLAREVALIKKLDITETAFIIGSGGSGRAVIAALLKMGFKKFNITEYSDERGAETIKELKSTYFGVDFRFTSYSAITNLPGVHSIVVNTTPFIKENEVIKQLYYCNFLKPNGVVIDLTMVPVETPLLKAVKQVEGRVIYGHDVAALVDLYWLKTSLGISVDTQKYTTGLKALCEGTTFDYTGFETLEF